MPIPAELTGPAGHGPLAVISLADGDAAGHLVADIAVDVRVEEVLRGHLEDGCRLAEGREVLGAVEQSEGIERRAGLECGPAQCDGVVTARIAGVGVAGSRHRRLGPDRGVVLPRLDDVGDDRAGLGRADGDVDRLAARDLDALGAYVERHERPVVLVGIALDFGEHEVGDIRAGIGETPRESIGVANEDTG